jgi:acetylornithine deacetylase|tara:strand:+ start:40534 stop:41658 length:1125 start_codon:yes stop_codon:yes gene_type:complete
MLTKLIATSSISSIQPQHDQGNLAVVDMLAGWLQQLDFKVEVLPVPEKPGKFNLIAVLGRGSGGLVLAGHTDTVPFDGGLWDLDPLKLVEKDQRFYGLGTCDMKGFFPLAIEAAGNFRAQDLDRPLIVLATADEESTMSGARALNAAQLCHARAALIGEPTSLQPVFQHKGIMMLSIRVTGKPGHSSDPTLGNSALDAMSPVLANLLEYRSELQHRYQNDSFKVPHPTVNLGCIQGGDNPNRICACVELEIDVRILPGMEDVEVLQDLDCRLKSILSALDLNVCVELLHPAVPPFENQHDSDLLDTVETLTGADRSCVAFASEAPYLQRLGMDTILLGPGSIDQAHQPNEFLELNQLQPTIDLIQHLIQKYCCR